MAIRVSEPSWLGCLIEGPGGDTRCSPLDDSIYDVPIQTNFQREIPGGDGPADIVLSRPEGEDGIFATDRVRQWMFAPVLIFDEGSRKVHESRIVGASFGPSDIQLETEGFAKTLEDDETARLLGIDHDLSRWEGPSVQRKLDWLNVGYMTTDPSTDADDSTGQPAVETAIDGDFGAPVVCEAWYDANGLPINFLDHAWKVDPVTGASGDTLYEWLALLSNDDVNSASDSTADLQSAGPGSGTLAATTATRKRAMVRFRYTGTWGTGTGIVFWTMLTPIGMHGIPLQGSVAAPSTGRGLLVSDTVKHIVSKWGTLLTTTDRSIEPTIFVVPHLVFLEDTTALDMIESLVLFGGNSLMPLDWGVWGHEFWMASPGNYGRVWRARLDEGAEEAEAGDDAHERINGIRMAYDDGTGSEQTVGPPGSGSNFETTALEDTAPSNPVNAGKGADRRWRAASMGVTSQLGAVFAAQMIMAEANRKQWRGDIDLKGHIREESGNEEPTYMVKPGDRGVIEEGPDIAERRIINTAYDSSTRTCKASIGAHPNRQDVLFARAGIVLEGFI